MRANRVLIPLLIVATLAYDLVLVSSLTERSRFPDTLVAVLLGLAAGQVNLATLWGVLGRAHLPWRMTVPLIVPLAWGLAILLSQGKILPAYRAPVEVAVRLAVQSALLASILLLIRSHGARLLSADSVLNVSPPRRRQFTLRNLFAWTTAVAITLSLLKTLFENATYARILPNLIENIILTLVNILVVLTCAWLILDTRGRSKRLMAVLVTGLPAACLVGACFVGFILRPSIRNPHPLLAVLALWFVSAFYSGVALVVLRVAGFRLVWLSAEPADTAPISRE